MNTREELIEAMAEALFLTKAVLLRPEPTWAKMRASLGDDHAIIRSFRTVASAQLAAIEAHGARVVPKEATASMWDAASALLPVRTRAELWCAMITASPFAENPDA